MTVDIVFKITRWPSWLWNKS